MTTPAPYPDFDGTQACGDPSIDPDLFFPGPQDAYIHSRKAIAVCTTCTDWRRPCLAYALTHQVFGIWGGTTAATRDEMRRKHGIRAVPVQAADSRPFPPEEPA